MMAAAAWLGRRRGRMGAATTAVVLAAGRGTRMQAPDGGVSLSADQAAAADAGLKMLVPVRGHPFIAYVLHELAEAGFTEVCVVVGPGEDDPVRSAVASLDARRLAVSFAIQGEPLGSADALAAAEGTGMEAGFVVVNADNVYPATVLRAVRELDGPGLAGFDVNGLVTRSNIPPERVAAFALLDVDGDGFLADIVEKPTPVQSLALDGAPVSMTCWRFGLDIFDACRAVEPSPRGELELVDAVKVAMDRGARFRVVPVAEGVLDLSRRADIPAVARYLADVEPRP